MIHGYIFLFLFLSFKDISENTRSLKGYKIMVLLNSL